MTLAFLNIGIFEIVIILAIIITMVIAIGNYGKRTALGYGGSVLLSILATPLTAFIVISVLRIKKSA
jgi:hypothetical protein